MDAGFNRRVSSRSNRSGSSGKVESRSAVGVAVFRFNQAVFQCYVFNMRKGVWNERTANGNVGGISAVTKLVRIA